MNPNDKRLINQKLHNQSKQFAKSLKKYALPNKDTGYLDYTIKSNGYDNKGNDTYAIKAEAVFYAKYLNAKTNFIDRAISDVLPSMIYDIKDFEFKDLKYRFEIQDQQSPYQLKNKRK